MRTLAIFIVVIFGIILFAAPVLTHAFFPFGGKIVAVYFDPEACNDLVIVVAGIHGGIFELETITKWYTLPFPPLVGAWTLGLAASPAPCSDVLIGGSSQI